MKVRVLENGLSAIGINNKVKYDIKSVSGKIILIDDNKLGKCQSGLIYEAEILNNGELHIIK